MALEKKFAYCTNVHAGPDLASVKENLSNFTVKVRELLVATGTWGANESLGVGLWLADSAAREVLAGSNLQQLADWLQSHLLLPFTMNGFPQNNFHQPVVKHRVYEPMWWQSDRLDYTKRLIEILDGILPPGDTGSISTLPIGWSKPKPSLDQLRQAARNLKDIAVFLDRLSQNQHRKIVLAIEPEPGCLITDGKSIRNFFEQYLFDDSQRDIVARHITVCHDICHAAVMREEQENEFASYRRQGIRIGKIQVSSAIHVDWSAMTVEQRVDAFEHLSRFAEDRYLHQTTVVDEKGGNFALHEDLPELMESIREPSLLAGNWRVHFHVPIFYEKAGPLGTTRNEIQKCLQSVDKIAASTGDFSSEPWFTGHYEVETYAWSVLPESHRERSLAEDIASELRFLRSIVGEKVFPQPEKSLHLDSEEDR
ncbi:MAG: metabolite traffic protein EboE [Pirellulaceae bacterium]|nr:metabolite traffic protein EboE [Pirellulaceae bacterium]